MLKRVPGFLVVAIVACFGFSGIAFADEAATSAVDTSRIEETGANTEISDTDVLDGAGDTDDVLISPEAPLTPDLPETIEPPNESIVPDVVASPEVPGPDVISPSPSSIMTNAAMPPSDSVTAPKAAIRDGWTCEGGKTYYYQAGQRRTGWLVTDTSPDGAKGLQRYWLSSDGSLITGLIDAGSGWWAYGIADKGYVVRGMHKDPVTGYYYFAGNDGRLLTPGWHVTDAFGQGLQRYWIDPRAHAAIPGTSKDGWLHFTRGDTGYVARGWTPTGDGSAYVADNDGRLARTGWLVSDRGGQGLQRYWINAQGKTSTGLIDAGGGQWAFGVRDKGYVVRGMHKDPVTGYYYFAGNDGRLLTPGWHVTDAFGQGLQRYWIDSKVHGAVPGNKTSPYRFFVRGDGGYVLRGKVDSGQGCYLADNDGRLERAGWLVTDKYDRSIQRYRVGADGKSIIGHFRVGGIAYYGRPGLGYVLRGKQLVSGRGFQQMVLADNDGHLADFEGWLVTDKYDGTFQRYRLDSSIAVGFYGAHVGLFSLDGHTYYGREDRGYVVRGLYRAATGKWYLGNNEGYLQPLPAEWMDMYMLAQEFHSPTDWLILVDTNDPRVGIYHYNYSRGGWDVSQEWLCTVGDWNTPTVTGTFYIQNSGYSFGHGYTCYYWTQFYGDYLFHSIKYYPGTFDVMDGRLGVHASLGCVRLDINNAAWLQYNIPRDTKVFIY